jgi:hypothetical protein
VKLPVLVWGTVIRSGSMLVTVPLAAAHNDIVAVRGIASGEGQVTAADRDRQKQVQN